MPTSTAIVARNDVSTIAGKAASITCDEIVLTVTKLFVIRFFEEASAVHAERVVLSSWGSNFFILAFVASADAFEVISDFIR